MRVAVVAEQLLAPVSGGVGRYTAELLAALARTAEPRDAVTAWTAWHKSVEAASVSGVQGPRRLPLGRRALAAAWQRGLGVAPCSADLVHAPSPLAPPPRERPLVVTVHDAVPWSHPETLTPHGARWHRAMIERAVSAGATIVVPTQAVGTELSERLPGLAAGRVRVLGAGVAAHFLDEVDAAQLIEVRARLRLPERYLLSLATLEPRKGLDVLVKAIARLAGTAPPLLVVGQPGWGGVDLAAASRKAGLPAGAVRLLGRVSDADLAVVLREAMALVAPSRAEGFGLPVAEAMAVGTPVICSDAPALIEVAGAAALVTAVGDADALAEAISAVTRDAGLRERMAVDGRQRAVAFNWTAVAARAWALYRELVAAASR